MERREFLELAKDRTFNVVGSVLEGRRQRAAKRQEASRQEAAQREQVALERVAREAACRSLYAHIGELFETYPRLVRQEPEGKILPFPNGDDGWVVIEEVDGDKMPNFYRIYWLDQSLNPRPQADGTTWVIRSNESKTFVTPRRHNDDKYLNWNNNPSIGSEPLATEYVLHLTETLEP